MKMRAIFIYDVTEVLKDLVPFVYRTLANHSALGVFPLQDERGNTVDRLIEYWFKYSLYEMHHISFDGLGDMWRQEVPLELRRELIRPVHFTESFIYRSVRVPLEFQTYIPRLAIRNQDLFLYYD